jgi:hypothetical protein
MSIPQFTLTANLQDLIGSGLGYLKITLINPNAFASPIKVSGTTVLDQLTYVTPVAASVSVTLWGLDVLSPSNLLYKVEAFNSGNTVAWVAFYNNFVGSGTQDLSTLTPMNQPTFPAPTFTSANANTFYGGPTSGGAGVPTMRSIATADVEGVAVVDNPTAPQTISGQALSLVSAPLDLDANSPATITMGLVKRLNHVAYVGDGVTTGDIGAAINTAYGSLPSSGGTICVIPSTLGTPYNFSTPILFATSGKYVTLRGLGSSGVTSSAVTGTCLNYTPTTATAAITLDYVPVGATNPPTCHGLKDLTLVNNQSIVTGGSGSLAVGIQIGNTNAGANDAVMENVSVYGFGRGYVNTNNLAVNTNWVNPFFQGNTLAFQYASIVEKFVNGIMAGNGQLVQCTTNQTPELYFTNVNSFGNSSAGPVFDFTRSTKSPGNLNLISMHLENTQNSNAHYVQGNVNVTIIGGVMEDDNTTGTGDWMIQPSVGQCFVRVIGARVLSSRPYTNVFLFNANTRGVIEATNGSPSKLTAATFVGGAGAGNVTQQIVPVGTVTDAYQWAFESALKFPTATLTAVAPTVSASQVGLGSTTASTVGAAGAASALPATPLGYLIINVGGTVAKVPYYNA